MRPDNYQKNVVIATVTAPASEPVTTAEIKAQLRIDASDDNTLLDTYVKVARETIEALSGHRLVSRTEKLMLDWFPPCSGIVIPVAPVTAIGAITYYAEDGTEYTVSSSTYVTDLLSPLARIVLKSGQAWPTLTTNKRPVNAVQVAFTSGYAAVGSPADALAGIPATLRQAVKLLAGHMYENREETTPLTVERIPFGIKQILIPYTVWERKL